MADGGRLTVDGFLAGLAGFAGLSTDFAGFWTNSDGFLPDFDSTGLTGLPGTTPLLSNFFSFPLVSSGVPAFPGCPGFPADRVDRVDRVN